MSIDAAISEEPLIAPPDVVLLGTRKYNRSEFKVNSGGFEVNQRANLARLSTGNFVVAWHEGTPTDCIGRIYDSQGAPIGSNLTLHPFGSSGNQYRPSPAGLPNGGLFAAWGGASSYVNAHRFDGDLVPIGGEISVANLNAWPAVAAHTNGELVVALGTQDSPVFVRRFDPSGVAGGQFQVGAFVSGVFHPSAAYGSDGRFTVAWPAAGSIRARSYFSNEFSPMGPEFQVNTTNATQCFNPSIAYNSNNELVAAWSGAGPGDLTGVFLRRYGADGVALGPESLVNESTNGSQSVPNLSVGPSGDMFVTWQSGSDVYGRLFNSSGTALGRESRMNKATNGTQQLAFHAGLHGNLILDNTNLVIGWAGDGSSGPGVYLTMLQFLYDADIRITNQPANIETFPGSSAVFTVGASSGESLSYQWQFNTNTISGATNATLTLNNVQLAQAGSYQCIISNSILVRTSAVASLTVLQYGRCCGQLYDLGYQTNGVYTIDPDGPGGQAPMPVECLMTLAGGGWAKLTTPVANSAANTDASRFREYLYVQNSTARWYRTPVSQLVWNWNTGKDLYGVYSYSTGGAEGTFTVSPSGEHQLYGVGGSSGAFATFKCLIYYTSCKDPANAQVQLCQDRPGIFGGACQCGVTVYIRECLPVNDWTLQLTASPTNGGTLSGAGTYANGASASITATANPGFRFSHWLGTGVSDTNAAITTVLMTQSHSVTGVFVQATATLTLNVKPAGSGTVVGDGTYDSGTLALIMAEPLAANRFLYWEGSGITDTNAEVSSVLMGGDQTVTAHFTAPDLGVTNIIVPAGAIAGHLMQASWTLTNQGTAAAVGTWLDRVWLSPDNQIGDDLNIGSYPLDASVFVDGSLVRIQNVPVPPGLSGNYWLVVQVNSDGGVAELNYANNHAISPHPILITNLPCPNLRVAEVFAPSNVFAGQETVVEWVVTNAGPASTGSAEWRDAVYFSTDPQFDAGDQLFCTLPNPSALAPSGAYFASCTIHVPRRIQGPRYLIVRADYQNRVNECGADGDNIGVSGVMEIDLGPYPDLRVARVSTPFEAFSGQSTTISWAVTNAGSGITEEAFWYDTVYYSTNATFVPGQALASFLHSGLLATGRTYTATQQVTLPVGLSGTNFHFFVQTDSGNQAWEYVFENNNLASATRATDVHLTPPPDLEICGVLVAATAHAGADFTLSYCVTNRGANSTPNYSWQDGFYLSPDTNLNVQADAFLGATTHYGPLQRNEGYTASVTLRLPATANGPRYLIAVADSQNRVFELNKTNNHSSSATTMNILGLADLLPAALTAPPTALAGFDFTVSYRVTNAGPCPTLGSPWVDSFYLSTDQTLNLQTDTFVGEATPPGALGIGGAYQGNATLRVPIGLTGNRYLFLVTDRRAAVPESNEGNNTLLNAAPIGLQLASNDLSVAAIGLPNNAVAGFSFTATYVVTNSGLHSVPNTSWSDAFYLSLDQALGTNDLFLGESAHGGVLSASGSYSNTVSFRLPDGLTGDFYLFVATDSNGEVYELNETNNHAPGAAAMRVVTIPPDLVVNSCQAGSNAIAGTSILVSWAVRNIGPGRTTVDDWHDRVVLSPDMTLGNGGDVIVAELPHAGGLDLMESYTRSEFATIPRSTAGGNYFIFVETDSRREVYEGTNNGNNFCLAGSISVIRPDVDLVVSNLVVTTEAFSGQNLTVAWIVRNLGNSPASRNDWRDHVYLSRSPEVTTNAILLGAVARSEPLGPGASYTVTNSLPLPWDIDGDFHIIVRADGTDVITESLEENNDTASTAPTYVYLSPTPDLIASTAAPAAAFSGQPVPLSWNVVNLGAATTERWYDSVYLSLDTVLERNTDLFLGYVERTSGLDEGVSYSVDHAFDIPSGLSGSFYVIVITDSRNRVFERGNEANNTAHSATPMTLNLPPLSDFVVTSVTPPSGLLYAGETGTVSYVVLNQSANPVDGRWEDTVYVSSDPTWDVNDALIARVTMNRNVGAWDSYSETLETRIPGVVPGSYYVIVRSDIRNHIPEADEGNNLGISSGTVALDMIEIPLGGSRSNQLFTGTEHFYRVNTPTGEVLSITLDSAATNGSHELFTRFAQVPTRAQWDFSGLNPFSSDQQVLIPETQLGNYFNLVRGQNVPISPAAYTVRADILPFGVYSMNPDRAANIGPVTFLLSGGKLDNSTLFHLTDAGGRVFSATSQRLVDSAQAFVTFDLGGAMPGFAALHAANSLTTGLLTNAVFVQDGGGGELFLAIQGPGALRPNQQGLWHVTYGNLGSADIEIPLLLFYLPNAAYLAARPGGPHLGNVVPILGLPSVPQYSSLRPGELVTIPIYGRINGPSTAMVVADSLRSRAFSEIQFDYEQLIQLRFNRYPQAARAYLDLLRARFGTNVAQAFAGVARNFQTIAEGNIHYRSIRYIAGGWEMELQKSAEYELWEPLLQTYADSPSGFGTVGHSSAGVAASLRAIDDVRRTWVVIISRSDYSDLPSAPNLPSADRFGEIASDYFRIRLAVPDSQINWLKDKPGNAVTRSDVLDAIRQSGADADDNLVIYYTGHGNQYPDQPAYNGEWPFSDGRLTPEDLSRELSGLGAGNTYLILDTCFAQQFAERMTAPNTVSFASSGPTSSYGGRFTEEFFSNLMHGDSLAEAFRKAQEAICGRPPNGQPSNDQCPSLSDPYGLDLGHPWSDPSGFWEEIQEDIEDWIDSLPEPLGRRLRELCELLQLCDSQDTGFVRTIDPNEKTGPSGFGPSKFMAIQPPLPYTVYFENLPEASAATREIRIIDRLGAGLDPRSVRLSEIVFSKYHVSVPPERSFYQTRLPLDSGNGDLLAEITAFVDIQTREIRWTLRAIDPATGELPESAQLGLLPPNDATHRGEGFVSYTVLPEQGLATGTLVTNTATIIFDTNEPFDTAPVWNTIDGGAPTSSVGPLPSVALRDFTVHWSGSDDANGSGLQNFDIYVSDNSGPFQLWLSGATGNSAVYSGVAGHTYRFYSRARDNVGNVEPTPAIHDAQTKVINPCPPILDQMISAGHTLLVTNRVCDPDLSPIWSLMPGAPEGARINRTNGVFTWTPECRQGSSTNVVTVVAGDSEIPGFSLIQSFRVIVPECVEVGVGNTAVRAGQQGCVTIDLFSTVDLTNLTFSVAYPSNRFSEFSISAQSPSGSTGVITSITATGVVVRLTPPPGQFFRGPLRVGELCFTAATGLPSAFVPLLTADVAGGKPDGVLVGNAFGLAGRVVVVADRPLLEAALGTNNQREVIIFAPTPSTNVLQYVTQIADTNWQNGWEVIQTNLMERFSGITTNGPTIYLRARQK